MASPRCQIEQQREQSTRRGADPAIPDVDRHNSKGPDYDASRHVTPCAFGVRVSVRVPPSRHTIVTHHGAPTELTLYQPTYPKRNLTSVC
jgi:hypothetical protein